MGKTKEHSVEIRQKIINFHKARNSYGDISKRLDIPRSTVQSVVSKFAQFCTAQILPGRGRKQKLSPKTLRENCAAR